MGCGQDEGLSLASHPDLAPSPGPTKAFHIWQCVSPSCCLTVCKSGHVGLGWGKAELWDSEPYLSGEAAIIESRWWGEERTWAGWACGTPRRLLSQKVAKARLWAVNSE